MQGSIFLLTLTLVCGTWGSPIVNNAPSKCRVLPGDAGWPSEAKWAQLNKNLGGRLIKTIPLGSACHNPTFNDEKCNVLKERWAYPDTHFESSASYVTPLFQNASCDPFTPRESPCEMGNYPEYAIKVEKPEHIASGLKFAQENNIRVVIKNTGHDFLGRATGKGALSIWTHFLQETKVINFKSPHYTGKALKMGAGVQAYKAMEVAQKAGIRVVGGSCPTVGLAGGYTQGGGHGLLSSQHGMGADQVLEWEVVVADGRVLKATPTENSDLYWALSGGGAGTYGVVLSMTVRAYPDGPAVGMAFKFTQGNATADVFWKGVEAMNAETPKWTSKGAAFGAYLDEGLFSVEPGLFPGKSKEEVEAIIRPMGEKLESMGLTHSRNVTVFDNYLQFYNNYFGPLPFGPYTSTQVQGGRFAPKKIVGNSQSNKKLTQALRSIAETPGFRVFTIAVDVAGKEKVPNGLTPAWRDAALSLIVVADWDYEKGFAANAANQRTITEDFDGLLASVTGENAGAYGNEANYELADFQNTYFGSNYKKLKSIKKKYDEKDLFYGYANVGSEAWKAAPDGRLCRT